MFTAIDIHSVPVPAALKLARAMGKRPDLHADRIDPQLWSTTTGSMLANQRLDLVANLLRGELAPAIAESVAALGSALEFVSTPGPAQSRWLRMLIERLDRTCRLLLHASTVLAVAERRVELKSGEIPVYPSPKEAPRALAAAAAYQAAEEAGYDVLPSLIERFGHALCKLVVPAKALVRAVEAGELEATSFGPMQSATMDAYNIVGAALIYAIRRAEDDAATLGHSESNPLTRE